MNEINDLAVKLRRPLGALGFLNQDTVRDLGSGATFPVSAETPGGVRSGDRFFRTDAGMGCYWDGARWLTQHEYAQPIANATGTFPTPPTALRRDAAPYFARVAAYSLVSGTNDGANYWTVTLQSINTTLTANDNIVSFTTAADAANVWTEHELGATVAVPTHRSYLRYNAVATGAPGALQVMGTAFYRLILT